MDLNLIQVYVEQTLMEDQTGHSLDHIQRVLGLARHIMEAEEVLDREDIILAAAYLHESLDDKLVVDLNQAQKELVHLLERAGASPEEQAEIIAIVNHQSYAANLESKYPLTLAGQVVQDADRLDALGAIGIARTFYYGGSQGNPLYDDKEARSLEDLDLASYRKNGSVINHFYEKLLNLEEEMSTRTGRQLARQRTDLMKAYLKAFYLELDQAGISHDLLGN